MGTECTYKRQQNNHRETWAAKRKTDMAKVRHAVRYVGSFRRFQVFINILVVLDGSLRAYLHLGKGRAIGSNLFVFKRLFALEECRTTFGTEPVEVLEKIELGKVFQLSHQYEIYDEEITMLFTCIVIQLLVLVLVTNTQYRAIFWSAVTFAAVMKSHADGFWFRLLRMRKIISSSKLSRTVDLIVVTSHSSDSYKYFHQSLPRILRIISEFSSELIMDSHRNLRLLIILIRIFPVCLLRSFQTAFQNRSRILIRFVPGFSSESSWDNNQNHKCYQNFYPNSLDSHSNYPRIPIRIFPGLSSESSQDLQQNHIRIIIIILPRLSLE